jgi:hypothetical protein
VECLVLTQGVILSKDEHTLVPQAYSSRNKITVALLTEGNVSSQEIRMCNNLVVGRSCSDLNGCEQDLSVQETQ